MKRAGSWFIGASCVLLVVAIGSVYVADYFERAWGRGGSLQIALIVGLGLTVAGAFGYLLTARFDSSEPTQLRAISAGAIFELVLFAFIEGTKYFLPVLNSLLFAGLAALVLGSASGLLVRRNAA